MLQKDIWKKVFQSITPDKTEQQIIELLEKNYTVTIKPKVSNIEDRKKIFANRIAEHKGSYESKMLRAFYSYWVECNDGGSRLRFEKEKVFEMKRRLKTWSDNETARKAEKDKPVKKYQELD